jgi:type IV fimbrial biogenesis protein FimT
MPKSIGTLRAVHRSGGLTALGFTLTELLVTIAVLTVLATIAAPSYSSLILSNRISTQVNALVAAINVARSEAVTRGNAVTICRSSDGASCAVGGTDWSIGWIVFSDPNVNATVDPGEHRIHAYPSMSNNTTALSVGAGMQQSLTFLGVGRPLGSFTGGEILVCPPSGGSYCRSLCVNSQGRPRVDTPAQRAADATCGN